MNNSGLSGKEGQSHYSERKSPQENENLLEKFTNHPKLVASASLSTLLTVQACERGVDVDTEVQTLDSPAEIKQEFEKRKDSMDEHLIQNPSGYAMNLYSYEDTGHFKVDPDGSTSMEGETDETNDIGRDIAEDIEVAAESNEGGVFVRFKSSQLSRGVYDRPFSNIQDLLPNLIERESIETDQTHVYTGGGDIESELSIDIQSEIEARARDEDEAILEAFEQAVKEYGDKDNIKEVEAKFEAAQENDESDSAKSYSLENVVVEYGGILKDLKIRSESEDGVWTVTLIPVQEK